MRQKTIEWYIKKGNETDNTAAKGLEQIADSIDGVSKIGGMGGIPIIGDTINQNLSRVMTKVADTTSKTKE